MMWLNKLMGRAHTHTMSSGKGVNQAAGAFASPVLLARGKWVMHQNQIGIIADVNSSGICEMHLVNEIGETVEQTHAHVGDVRVAKLREIPEKRRPTADHGASLGYL